MINYTIPGLTECLDIDLLFLEIRKARPDMFYDDVQTESVYGGFPGCRLGGGRNNEGEPWPLAMVQQRIERFNALGVACNVTFSNQFANACSLGDNRYDRQVLEVLADSAGAGAANGVIVYDDGLARAIRHEFPSLRLIASTTKSLVDVDAIETAFHRYDRVVLDYNLTHDEASIAQLSQPEKLEIMVNEYCTLQCEFRDAHYRAVSAAQLRGEQADFPCSHATAPQAYGFLSGLINGNVFLRNEDIRRYRDDLGIGSFKIVGRGLARYDVVDSYLYYLVKPEAWYEIRDFMIHHDFF